MQTVWEPRQRLGKRRGGQNTKAGGGWGETGCAESGSLGPVPVPRGNETSRGINKAGAASDHHNSLSTANHKSGFFISNEDLSPVVRHLFVRKKVRKIDRYSTICTHSFRRLMSERSLWQVRFYTAIIFNVLQNISSSALNIINTTLNLNFEYINYLKIWLKTQKNRPQQTNGQFAWVGAA